VRLLDLEALDDRMLDGLEFCAKAFAAFDRMRGAPDGATALRMRRSRQAKRLVEEVLPIADYILARYRLGLRLKVRWLSGNQPFDARLVSHELRPGGTRIRRVQLLEVTRAVHPNEHLSREHVTLEGGSFGARGTQRDPKTKRTVSRASVYKNSERQLELAGFVQNIVAQKAAKAYPPRTSLIVVCVTEIPLDEHEWYELVEAVQRHVVQDTFREIVLQDPLRGRIATLVQNRRSNRRRSNQCLQPTAAGPIMSRRG
jgi:hypothetical protein